MVLDAYLRQLKTHSYLPIWIGTRNQQSSLRANQQLSLHREAPGFEPQRTLETPLLNYSPIQRQLLDLLPVIYAKAKSALYRQPVSWEQSNINHPSLLIFDKSYRAQDSPHMNILPRQTFDLAQFLQQSPTKCQESDLDWQSNPMPEVSPIPGKSG